VWTHAKEAGSALSMPGSTGGSVEVHPCESQWQQVAKAMGLRFEYLHVPERHRI